jgi:hypothetical protein
MSDTNIRIPADARDRLAETVAAEGRSLRAYLARIANNLLTPGERADLATRAREVLREWNGYDPTEAEQTGLDIELDRRLADAAQRAMSCMHCEHGSGGELG